MSIEKKNDSIGIRLSDTEKREVDGLAEMHGMCRSEWILHVVRAAIAEEKSRYKSLSSVFGDDCLGGKN